MRLNYNVLELFAGSRSVGRNAEQMGCNVFSVDWEKYEGINLAIDIENLEIKNIPFVPDFIWLSPDCTTYTVAAISRHRNGIEPKSEYAKKCDRVNTNALKIVNECLLLNPNLVFCIENPRGMMRKMPFMKGLPRVTVWYCQYGDYRAKPTDIWSNNIYSIFNQNGWIPKAECHNGNKNCHHEIAPRGSNTGMQGKKGSYERSRIPDELCISILKSAMKKLPLNATNN
jgi:site-specific DNA-cytosine methylase